MNPYVQFALAMCLIVGLSLAGTAYLAAMFNRKAKADLKERLEPLAAAIDGEVDLDEATVKGRHGDALAFGRVANAPGGFGRLFHTELVDAAGGERWEWSNLPEKGRPAPKRVFDGDPALRERLGLDFDALAAVVPEAATQRWGWAYDPEAGMVRLSRAMRTRADIPDAAQFVAQLDALAAIGDANRRAQQGPGDSLPDDSLTGADTVSASGPHPPARHRAQGAPGGFQGDARERGSVASVLVEPGEPARGDNPPDDGATGPAHQAPGGRA